MCYDFNMADGVSVAELGIKEADVSSPREYQTEVSSIEEPMTKLCTGLNENLQNDNYGLILGDDTSGRLPALVVKGVSDHISDAAQRERVPTFFIQAGRYMSDDEVSSQFEERIASRIDRLKGRKVLLITEHIDTGGTLDRLIKLFVEHNIPFDIAVMHMGETVRQKLLARLPATTSIRIGQMIAQDKLYPVPAPEIWSKEHLSGLKKPHNPYEKGVEVARKKYPEYQFSVNQARGDVNLLVGKIWQTLRSSK